ncbi:ABC-type Co2+ transport system%2C permease component [uncultured Blautia sp.]|nr:ABC-type Co2+ transport system%2C permease component [uncultured Blautia sp.]
MGAVSCLYFLSLTTPVPEVLSVLRRLRMPGVLLDLAILIHGEPLLRRGDLLPSPFRAALPCGAVGLRGIDGALCRTAGGGNCLRRAYGGTAAL